MAKYKLLSSLYCHYRLYRLCTIEAFFLELNELGWCVAVVSKTMDVTLMYVGCFPFYVSSIHRSILFYHSLNFLCIHTHHLYKFFLRANIIKWEGDDWGYVTKFCTPTNPSQKPYDVITLLSNEPWQHEICFFRTFLLTMQSKCESRRSRQRIDGHLMASL